MMDQAMGQGAVRGSAPRSCWAWRRRHRGGRRTASAGASPDFNQLPSVIHPGVQPVASHVESQRSVNRIVAGQLAQRARALSDEDLQRLFEDLLDAKSEGPRTASAIVEEQVAAVEAEEDRPVTAWDDVSGSGRESSAFRTEAPSDPQPEDQGLRDADVRVEEDNRVPLVEETFAASAPPPEESNLDTAGAFVKDHLVSFELAGAAVVAASVLAIAARFLGSLLEPRQPDPEPLEEPPTDPPQEEPPSFSRDSGAGYYTRPPAQAGGVVWSRSQDSEDEAAGLGAAARSDAVVWTRRDSVDDDGGGFEPTASALQDNVE